MTTDSRGRLTSALRELATIIKGLTVGVFKALEDQSVEVLRLQYLELENAFLSLVLGGIVGLHLVPMGLAMELAPYLADEIGLLEHRHFLGADVIADYFSSLGGEW